MFAMTRPCRSYPNPVLAAALLWSALAPPAGARALWESWPVIDSNQDGDCRLEIRGNGKFMLLRATGLGAARAGRFQVTNETMKPVDWQIVTDTNGVFVRAYLPYLWSNADGTVRTHQTFGTVMARVSTRQCSVTASAPWATRIRVIP